MEEDIKKMMEALSEPMPYKWRVQSFSKAKPQATCVAYIDSRDVQRRLDEVLGADRWQSDFKEVKGNLFAGIGILFYSEECGERWVWKWDCGTESNTEKEKGEASDSFKRAAVKWGPGRFLYDLGMQYVAANEKAAQGKYPFLVDAKGNRIWDLTKHIISTTKSQDKPAAKPARQSAPAKPGTPLEAPSDNQVGIDKYNELLKKIPEAQQKALQLTQEQKDSAERIRAGIKYLNNIIETKKSIQTQTVKK